MSAEFCGCDREANWICESHRTLAESIEIRRQIESARHARELLRDKSPDRAQRIRQQLWPSDGSYCAEPISIEDARWLLTELENSISREREAHTKVSEAFDDAVKQEHKRGALMAALTDAGLVAGELSNGRFKIYKGKIRPTDGADKD